MGWPYVTRTYGTGLLIEVGDHSTSEPRLAHSDGDDIGGRGLILVDALSSRWGCYFDSYAHKVVWAIIDELRQGTQNG